MTKRFEELSVFALAAAGSDQCFAATEAGLWRWHAGARIIAGGWRAIAPQFAAVPLLSVAASGDTVWIGAQGDIAVSRDGGESWGLSTLPAPADVLALAVSPAYDDDRLVLAATANDGVLRSVDGGATFHAWNFGLLDLRINALAISPDFAADGHVIAVSDHAAFVSRNGGRAWREIALPDDVAIAPFTGVSIGVDGALLIGTEETGLWLASAVDAAPARDAGFKPVSVNALHGDIAATPDGVFERARGRWKRVAVERNAMCLTRCGARLFAGGDSRGVWDVAT